MIFVNIALSFKILSLYFKSIFKIIHIRKYIQDYIQDSLLLLISDRKLISVNN